MRRKAEIWEWKYTSLLLNAAWENQTIIVINWSFTLLDYWKFIACERRELFCFWSRKELFHSKLTRKVLMFLLIFLGSTRWFQMFVIEMPLSIHCIFSKTFPFVAFFNIHFVVTKLRNSTLELHPLYKSSLWNLKWLVWLLITLFLYYYFFWENRRLVIRSCRSRGKLCRGLRWRYQ